MFLKELLSCLNRTLWGQFLREICSFKNDPESWPFIDSHNMKAAQDSGYGANLGPARSRSNHGVISKYITGTDRRSTVLKLVAAF
jgi:hypothetical protein